MTSIDLLVIFSTIVAIAQLSDIFFFSRRNTEHSELIFKFWYSIQANTPIGITERVRNIFNSGFDFIYGDRHFSFKCILRSILFSLFWVFVVIILSFYTGVDYSGIGHSTTGYTLSGVLRGFVEEMFSNKLLFLLFVQNFAIDYASLMETRVLMRRFSFSTPRAVASILSLDLILSLSLISIPVVVGYYAYNQHFHPQRLVEITDVLAIFFGNGGNKQIALPFIYSTLGSSFLLYILIVVSLFVRLLWLIKAPVLRVLEWLANQERPITTIAAVASLVIMIALNVLQLNISEDSALSDSIDDISIVGKVDLPGNADAFRFSPNRRYISVYGWREYIVVIDTADWSSRKLNTIRDPSSTKKLFPCDNFEFYLRESKNFCRSGLMEFSKDDRYFIYSDHQYIYRVDIMSWEKEILLPNEYVSLAISVEKDNVLLLRGKNSIVFFDLIKGEIQRKINVYTLNKYASTQAVATQSGVFFRHRFWSHILHCSVVSPNCINLRLPNSSYPFTVSAKGDMIAVAEESEASKIDRQNNILLSVYRTNDLQSTGTVPDPVWHAPIDVLQGDIMTAGFLDSRRIWATYSQGAMYIWDMKTSEKEFKFYRVDELGGLVKGGSSFEGDYLALGGTIPKVKIFHIDR